MTPGIHASSVDSQTAAEQGDVGQVTEQHRHTCRQKSCGLPGSFNLVLSQFCFYIARNVSGTSICVLSTAALLPDMICEVVCVLNIMNHPVTLILSETERRVSLPLRMKTTTIQFGDVP